MTVFKWSTTAANNDDADTSVNWLEGQAPSTINNSARAMMAAIAKWRDDMSGNLVTGGTSTAYTLTTNQVYTALTDGISVTCRMSATNGASPTLNVDSLGAKSIAGVYGTAIGTGLLYSGSVQTFVYDSTDDKWIVHTKGGGEFASGTSMIFYASSAPTGWTGQNGHGDHALRIVTNASGNGGSTGGSTAFTSVMTARTIAQANLPNVNLNVSFSNGGSVLSFGSSASNLVNPGTGAAIGNAGAAVADLGGSGTPMDFAVAYLNVIRATKA